MKIKTKYPPNINKIKEKFGNIPNNLVFTYKNILYSPSGRNISKDLKVHEKVHIKQQGDNSDSWWNKYLNDESFRLNQELEAYKKQYNFFKNTCKIKSRIPQFLNKIASDLSGTIYGNIISFDEAKRLIS